LATTRRPPRSTTRARADRAKLNAQVTTPALPAASKVDRFVSKLAASPGFKEEAGKTRRLRLLSVRPAAEPDKGQPVTEPRWQATWYDYDNNLAIDAVGALTRARPDSLVSRLKQPLPVHEEWQEAARIVEADRRFGPALRAGRLRLYRAMPPLSTSADETGRVERALHLGVRPTSGTEGNEVLAVNLVRGTVERYQGGHPPTSRADADICGAPEAFDCPTPPRGTLGEAVIAWPAARPVWRFRVIRPAASSGTNGSGIELRDVRYKNRLVLYQAHVPILNVLYDNDACGPYRDWFYEEHCFRCDGTDLAPGIRWASAAPQTICESGSDDGNFTGVAVWDAGDELVLVSEMSAGWYRYIMEWRLHKDGTIRPRFRFAATDSSCVCRIHTHHAYWRLDFDLQTAKDNLVDEYNNPPLAGGSPWRTLTHEVRRARDYARSRKWRVRNSRTGRGYEIVPGAEDGLADAYGRGDFWLLRYRGSAEIDDGYADVGGPGTAAEIDRFVNGESVRKRDLVVWYAAHFRHDLHGGGAGCHEVGPDIKPIKIKNHR
jgi:hypothetical protein